MMQVNNVWVVITKSRPLPGCEIDMDGCEFYFADAFVPTEPDGETLAMIAAIHRVKDALASKNLELADVILCVRFFPAEWVDQTDSVESTHELADKAMENGVIVFSEFRSEEIQELYHYTHTIRTLDSRTARELSSENEMG